LGEQVRSLVQIQQNEVPVIQAEVSLYMSQRAQLIAKEINPRLFDNQIVVTDRSDGTNLAFQGFGRGQNILRMAVLNGYAVENIHPDITIYLDIPDKEIIRRGQVTVEEFDRYEHESGEFHQLCRQGYEEALRLDQISLPQTWFRVDAVGTPEEVHENIWEIMRPKLFN
jgi:dTMP kinase